MEYNSQRRWRVESSLDMISVCSQSLRRIGWLLLFFLSFSRELHRTLEPLKLPFGFESIDWNFNSISEWRIAGFHLEITSESLTANSIIWRRDWKFGRVLPTWFSFQMRSPTVLFNFFFFKPLNIQIEWLNRLRRTLLSLLKWQGITPGCDRIPSSLKFTHRTQALVSNQVFAFVSMGISSVGPSKAEVPIGDPWKTFKIGKFIPAVPFPQLPTQISQKYKTFQLISLKQIIGFDLTKCLSTLPKNRQTFPTK